MRTAVFVLAATLTGGGSAALAGDPLQAPACRQALQELQRQEGEALARAAPAASAPRANPALLAAQRKAARACLQGRDDTPPPSPQRLAQPPLAVTPLRIDPSAAPVMRSATEPLQSASPPPPVSITSCDAAGCWASDGTRLQRVGAQLIGPRGVCRTVGTLVSCP
jgi:hypothetical protein